MKNLKHLLGGALLLALPLSLTSCNDIIGDLDNPISSPSTPSTPAIKYLVWNTSTEQLEEKELPSDYTSMTATTTEWKGNYIVDSDIEIASDVTLTGDVNIVLKDGVTLEIHGNAAGEYKLCIYAQSSDAAGKFRVGSESTPTGSALAVKELEIHGGDIFASGRSNSSAAGDDGITTSGKLYIYAGTVMAYGGDSNGYAGGDGIYSGDDLYIYTGTVTATGGKAISVTAGNGGRGIYCAKNIEIYKAEVTATGGECNSATGGIGIKADGDATYQFIIKGGTVKAIGGNSFNSAGAYGIDCQRTNIYSGKLYAQGGNYTGTGPVGHAFSLNFYYAGLNAYKSTDGTTYTALDSNNPTEQYVKVE